eukprot:TRINITY_DN6577_c0_g1_i4.p2 TRINITY_DN6577_c0_g1~~TRINITY_DN6577_c0_g1_i4.p2  ORF type:complete len:410 (-),score=80.31 TRINITY_DN6577_c0_g1_i4:69-1298(-)
MSSIAEIQKELEDEREFRLELAKELQNACIKIDYLEKELQQEKIRRKNLQQWIKENIGTELEQLKSLIRSEVKNQMQISDKTSEIPNFSSSDVKNTKKKNIFDDSPSTTAKSTLTKSAPPSTTNKIRISAATPLLERIELVAIGDDEKFPPLQALPKNDASFKVNKSGRITHLLTTQNHSVEKYSCPNLIEKVTAFAEMGGKFLAVPSSPEDLKQDDFKFAIKPNDTLLPICADGLRRSQVLYLVLQGMKRKLGVEKGVHLPHGALHGYDPFVIKDHPKDIMQQYKFLSEEVVDSMEENLGNTVFYNTFGMRRSQRFGQDKCGDKDMTLIGKTFASSLAKNAVISLRESQRDYFNLYYYRAKQNQPGRLIYLAFGSAVPVVLDRIMECNQKEITSTCIIIERNKINQVD